ncbi:MAG: autotransporter-associated beta strand repeat-containing protein [Verrucomicrobiaceae bacterium]|nr:autotransporter-associated beta strand repeat-containing protein [Verrucomicrobiaceae bacterium]
MVEPAFEEFRRWTEHFAASGAEVEKGVELALQRRSEMLDLIDKNPRRALELAVPESVRQRLPAGVVALLEERVEQRGDLLVQATTSSDGGCQINRTATLRDGRVFEAHTFGRRGAMPTRDNIAIHGVALDGKLALADLPGRVLEPVEVAAWIANGGKIEGGPDLIGDTNQSSEGDEVVIAWDDQRMTRYRNERQAVAAMIDAESGEQSAAPATDGSDLDGVVMASPWTEGPKTLLLIRVDFPDFQGQVVSDATLEQLIADLNTHYAAMSSGKTSFALLGQGSAITPTVRMPNNSSAYASHTKFSRVLTDARAAAAAAGFNYLNYTHEVVVMGATPVVPATSGMANVGARGAWVYNTQWNLKTTGHELGHNFGLPHSGAWDTDDGSVIGPGEVWDYGNVFDMMGVGSASASLRHFGAMPKQFLDWIPMADVIKITTDSSTTSRIRAMDKVQADGNKRALAVDRAGSTDDYWVEYRQLFGTSFGLRDGVLVNWADINGGYQQPLLLDMAPDTFQKDDAVLPMGKTFSDTAAGIHITPVARGTDGDGVEWMDVTVNRGTFAGNLKPTVTLGSSTANPAVNASVTFTATASDPNGDTLAYFWDWGDGTTTANNSSTASKSWSTAGLKTVRCIVSDMKGLTTTAPLLVQVGSSSTFFIQGVVSTTLGVPMQGVVVRASPTQSATTDGDGYYAITGLAAGSYTLTATKTGASFVTSGFTNPVTVGPSQQGKNFLAPPGAPVFTTAMKPGLTDQGSNTGAIPLPLADSDTAVSALTLTAASSDQGIIPDASITFGGTTTRTITASAGSTVSGSVDITITATDPEGNTGTHVWPVTVNAKPVLAVTTPTTTENTPVDIDLRAFVSDDITVDEKLFFEVDRVRNGRMTLLPDGHTARFTPNPNFNGTTNYRLVVRDQSLGAGFRFLYDFEPPDIHTDALSTDQSNYNRTGTLQSINSGTYAYDASVPPALSPQSEEALVLAQNGTSAARLRRTLTTADHNLNDADWTFSAWVKRGGNDTEDFVFHLGDGDGHGTENELELFFAAGSDVLKLQKWGAGGLEKEIVVSDIPSGQWHHLTLSYDRTATNTGTFYLYVGRFLRGSVSAVTMNVNQAAPVVAGGHNSTTANVDRWFDGVMDEVLFQNGLSTRTEIYNRSRMGARHYHGLSVIGNNLTLTVTGANQAPSIAAVPDRYVPVNASSSPVTVRLSDAETEARNLTLTAVSSNQAIIPNANITVGAAPAAWTNSDIGTVTTTGSLTESRGTYIVNGAGAAGIGPAAGDAFRWVRQSFTGDGEIVARVVSVDHTASNAEAGLMMRESTAATARFVSVRVTGSDGVSFVQRTTASTDAVVTATLPLASAPCWLRLVRSGSGYSAFFATDNDGVAGAWQAVGTEQTVAFTGTTHDIGMAVSSRVDTTLCAGVFDNLGGTVLRGGERTVSLTPAAGQSGSSVITLTASDGSQTGNTSFTVIVDGAAPTTTVWNATTTGTLNWSSGSNWTGGVPPPSSRFSTIAFFTDQTVPSGTITSNNDTAGGHALNVLTLGGTGPTSGSTTMTLGGNALLMRRESLLDPVVNLSATNGTGFTWNVSASMTMEDSTTFQGAGTASFNFSGILSGTGNLIKTGTSKLILSGANDYTGITTISSGILQIGDDGATGSLPAGAVVNNAMLRFDRTGTLLVPNAISGSGGVTIDCPINNGTVVLSGSNSFTGHVTVNSGALRITNSGALGSTFSSKNIILTNATAGNPQLRLDGSSGAVDMPAGFIFKIGNAAGAIFNEAGDNILRGNIVLTSGGNAEGRVSTIAGSLRLAGTITNDTAAARTFVIGGATGTGQVEGVISDGTLTGGTVALRKIENGTWTLTGPNTFTGATTLNAGTLRINAPGSLHSSSTVTVNAAILGGDGSIGGSVVVNASGRIAPGSTAGSAGTLAIGGGLNVTNMTTGTGKLVFELGAPTASDKVTVGGTFTFGSGTLGFDDFTFTGLSGLTAGTYKLITATGISGTLDSTKLTGTLGGFNAALTITGTDLEIILTHPFTTWQTANGTSGTIANDHDNDGVPDGIEYFLGGTSNTTGQTTLPGVTNTGGTLSITWTKSATYPGTYGTNFWIESSDTLTGTWTTETVGGTVTVNGNNITYTFPASTRRFVRLKVVGP